MSIFFNYLLHNNVQENTSSPIQDPNIPFPLSSSSLRRLLFISPFPLFSLLFHLPLDTLFPIFNHIFFHFSFCSHFHFLPIFIHIYGNFYLTIQFDSPMTNILVCNSLPALPEIILEALKSDREFVLWNILIFTWWKSYFWITL